MEKGDVLNFRAGDFCRDHLCSDNNVKPCSQ